MTSESESSGDAVLSDAERLQALEKTVKLNRLILLGLAAVVLVIVLVTVIVQSVNLMSSDPADEAAVQIDQLKKQLHSVQGDLSEMQDQLHKQEAQLTQVAQQPAANSAASAKPAQSDPGTVEQVSKTLLGQEKDFQQVVQTLQVGMRDLAYMLPGSRSWLELYTESLNKSVATSKLRSNDIQQWAKGQLPVTAAPTVKPVAAPVTPVKAPPPAPAKH